MSQERDAATALIGSSDMPAKYHWAKAQNVDEVRKDGIGYVLLTLEYEKEGNKWVGTCRELGTNTFARTLKQCQVELEELVIEFLNILEEDGERERFFKKWDIKFRTVEKHPQEHYIIIGNEEMERFLQMPLLDISDGPFFQPRLFFPTSPERTRRSRRELAGV